MSSNLVSVRRSGTQFVLLGLLSHSIEQMDSGVPLLHKQDTNNVLTHGLDDDTLEDAEGLQFRRGTAFFSYRSIINMEDSSKWVLGGVMLRQRGMPSISRRQIRRSVVPMMDPPSRWPIDPSSILEKTRQSSDAYTKGLRMSGELAFLK